MSAVAGGFLMVSRWMKTRLMASLAAAFVVAMSLVYTAPAEAGVDIKVNLATQTLTATTPDGTVKRWAISSGRNGYKTPRGVYRPQVMKPYHWSRKYGGHMPHAIFFRGGFAIHGTTAVSRLGAPDSHGCVRLHPSAARELYALVKQNGPRTTRIAINGNAPDTGKTMLTSRKIKQQAVAARPSRDRDGFSAPAFAPQQLVPNNQLWQRLR
jgi:lipoprotein-anchoring transpeptidase ErfK/SrfK